MTGPAILSSSAVLWGAFDPSDWQGVVRTDAYTALGTLVGKQMSITHSQCSWITGQNKDGTLRYSPFPAARLQDDCDKNRHSLITWQSANLNNKSDPSTNLRSIVLGAHDAYITTWLQAAAAYRRQLIVRLDHEMNGSWFPTWSEQDGKGNPANGNQLGDYVKAWQHIVTIARQVGATNITWLWCPNVINVASSGPLSAAGLAEFYPGKDWVDLVGTDLYNWGGYRSQPWMTFTQCLTGYPNWYGDTHGALQKLAPGKPFFLAEFGCHDGPGDKGAWITDALAQIGTSYPDIIGWCWFNWAIGAPPANWPINIPPAAAVAFAGAIAAPKYLTAGGFPFGPDLTPVQPYVLAVTPDLDAQVVTLRGQITNLQGQVTADAATLASSQAAAEQAAVTAMAAQATATATQSQLQVQLDQANQQVAQVTDQLTASSAALAAAVAAQAATQSQLMQLQQAAAQFSTGLDALRAAISE